MSEQVATKIIDLLTKQNELLSAQYTVSLAVIGVSSAGLVLFLLYRFIKLFY